MNEKESANKRRKKSTKSSNPAITTEEQKEKGFIEFIANLIVDVAFKEVAEQNQVKKSPQIKQEKGFDSPQD